MSESAKRYCGASVSTMAFSFSATELPCTSMTDAFWVAGSLKSRGSAPLYQRVAKNLPSFWKIQQGMSSQRDLNLMKVALAMVRAVAAYAETTWRGFSRSHMPQSMMESLDQLSGRK